MEDSWRFRPLQGTICPTCSISHYPFCYQPPPFNRFPNGPAFNRPVLDPFSGNCGMPPPPSHFDNSGNSMRQFSGNSNDGYGMPQSFNRNQNFDRNLFAQTTQFPNSGSISRIHRDGLEPNPGFGYGGSGFTTGEVVESDRTHKRMRVGEMGPSGGPFVQMPPLVGGYGANPARMSSEDERRLNLIRDHGAPPSVTQSQVGMDSRMGMADGVVNQVNGYLHERLPGVHFGVNESSRSDLQTRFPSNTKMNGFLDPRFGSSGGMRPMLSHEPVFDPHYHAMQSKAYNDEKKEMQRGGHDLGFVQQQLLGNMRADVDSAVIGKREENGKDALFASEKDQKQHPDYFKHPSLQNHGHSNNEPVLVTRNASNYVTPAEQIWDPSSVVCREDEYQHWGASQRDEVNKHSHVAHQQLLPNNHAKEPHHPQLSNLTVSPASGMPAGENHSFHFHDQQNDMRQSFEIKHLPMENINKSIGPHNLPVVEQFGVPTMNRPGAYLHVSTSNSMVQAKQSQMLPSQPRGIHPPLPHLLPRPLPLEPPGVSRLPLQARSSSPKVSSIYPVPTASSVIMPLNSSALESRPFPLKNPSPDKAKVIDASCLFLPPHRATRPDHIVIILRGFPGSGKSYLAKMLRDLEVEKGGSAPRIHSMDDYFMTEVEKVEAVEGSKSSSAVKGKKRTAKKVMEYCYEPEMEEAYRSSMLKAFKKTLEEGSFTFVIVDDRNLRVADFAQFWASAKRSGYEVYLLEATYKDPVGCAARNVHGFTSDDIHKMAELWEDAPSLYLQLDVQPLFHGDSLKESEIQEVDMDMEDAACGEGSSELTNSNSLKMQEPSTEEYAPEGPFKDERWDAEVDDPTRVKELGRSKWSNDDVEDDNERLEGVGGNSNALSGLIQAYSKGEKSVHWGDQVGKMGFSIGTAKKANSLSLVIGPGAGYNLKSNPLPEEENVVATEHGWQSKKRSVFEEQLRAERESFRAVFDRRRHRIGGLEMEEE